MKENIRVEYANTHRIRNLILQFIIIYLQRPILYKNYYLRFYFETSIYTYIILYPYTNAISHVTNAILHRLSQSYFHASATSSSDRIEITPISTITLSINRSKRPP